ncbi:MAG: isoamylase [Treponema sp.]|nr:isoamylase [Treponema sp.]
MKTIRFFVLLMVITSCFSVTVNAADWETYELIDKILALRGPTAPIIYEDMVVFTADSKLRRVGIAFAHENFANTYWFRQLLVSQDRLNAPIPPGAKVPDPYIDSGIQFHVYEVPGYIKELEYRIIINGLWTIDPSVEKIRRDPISGLTFSVLPLPHRPQKESPLNGLPEGLHFTFRGPPGESITVAGDFNSWDPFMYELKETTPGNYSLTIPMPSGTYKYVFFYRGQRYADPHNPRRVYTADGKAASEIAVP